MGNVGEEHYKNWMFSPVSIVASSAVSRTVLKKKKYSGLKRTSQESCFLSI